MPIRDDQLDAIFDQHDAERARASAAGAPAVAPDQMARALQLAQRTGAPAQAIAADPAPFEADDHLARIDAAVAGRPGLADWLAHDPAHPALARDELPALAAVHDAAAPAQRRSWFGLVAANLFGGFSGLDALKPLSDAAGEVGDTVTAHVKPAALAAFTQPMQMATDLAATTNDALAPVRKLADLAARDAERRGDRAGAAALRTAFDDPLALQAATDHLAGVNRAIADEQQGLQRQHPRPTSLADALRRPTDAVSYYAGQLTDSLPAMLLAMATRNPEAAAGMIGGTSGAQQYTADRNGAGDEAPMGRLASLVDASGQAALEAGGEMIPFAEAFKPGARRFLVTPFAEGASEAVTQVAQTNAQDAVHGTSTPVGEQLGQALDAFIVGHGLGLGMAALGGGHGDEARSNAIPTRWFQAARAAVDRDYLGKVMEAARGAKLRTRAPGAFEDLLQRQVGDTTVHVPAEQLAALFQSERVPDPAAAVATLTGDPTAWAEAQATGGSVAIPLARYATYLADAHATLAPHVTLEADTALAAEDAKAAGVPTAEQFQADLATALEAARASSARDTGAAGEVYDHFYGQLLGATDEVNAGHIAATMQALYSTWGERMGLDPRELLRRFQININGALKAGATGARRDVDLALDPLIDAALAGKDAFSDAELYGPSLIPLIAAAGGINPESVGAGDLLSADAQQRPGLLSLTGQTLEAMAESFSTDPDWAAHFSTRDEFGRADYREFADLIRRELGGEAVRAIPADATSADRVAAREAFRRDTGTVAAAIRQHAERTGVDPKTLPRETLRALAEQALSGEDALAQPAYHGTHARGIEQFSLQKIGTGEGAQVYGWGLYFASHRGIAEWYRQSVSERRNPVTVKLANPEGGPGLSFQVGTHAGDGEFSAWLGNEGGQVAPDVDQLQVPGHVQDPEEWRREVIQQAVANIEEELGKGAVPTPAWVDYQVRNNGVGEEEAPIYQALVRFLYAHNAQTQRAQESEFSFTYPDGERHTVEVAAETLQDEVYEQFAYGQDDDEDVARLARAVPRLLREGTPVTPDELRGYATHASEGLLQAVADWVQAANIKHRPLGQLYKVEVPEDDELLDYDKPMAEQPPAVLDALHAAGYVVDPPEREVEARATQMLDAAAADWADEEDGRDPVDFSNNENFDDWVEAARAEMVPPGYVRLPRDMTGRGFYQQLMDDAGFRLGLFEGRGEYQRAASETLLGMGIKGLRYLDANSRGNDTGERTHNYVIWDEGAVGKPEPLYQGALATTGEQSETYAHEEQILNARLADWADALHLGSGGPRAVAVRPEDFGAVDRRADHGGAVEQGDASRADIAEQSQRLIEHAKAGGFFWGSDSPILFALQHLPSAGGAEHQVFMVGSGDDRLIIRATDNGYFGPRADISPAQYLARLEDYSRTFPELQTRLIGVSESPDVAGHAVIWTVQRFVRGQRLATQPLLVEAFAKQGWEAVGDPYSYEFRHTATGATIADAHTDNVYQGENGALYPFDVVVTHLAEQAALHQDAAPPPFYSQLLRAVEGHKQGAAPAAQWVGLLSNLPGIRKEELEYYNLVPWLTAQHGKVTREAIADYLRANELQVVDVLKGDAPAAPDGTNLPYRPEQDETGMWNVRGPDGRFVYSPGQHWGWVGGPNTGRPAPPDQDQAERSAYDMSTGYLRTQGTRLANPGTDHIIDRIDARDVADFGLEPEQLGEWAIFDRPDPRDRTEGNNGKGEFLMALGRGSYADAARSAAEFMGEQGIDATNLQAPDAPYSSLTLPGGSNYRVLLLQLPPGSGAVKGYRIKVFGAQGPTLFPTREAAQAAIDEQGADAQRVAGIVEERSDNFTGGHWQEPNVVAHVRFDERTDADGKRVLFVQELQSDWHQQGRKKGYAGDVAALREQYSAVVNERAALLDEIKAAGGFSAITHDSPLDARYNDIDRRMRDLDAQINAVQFEGVPEAPFKTTWPELVVKRMLRYAAERGFDKVAFPTPAQVPQIEGWGRTLEQIKANPTEAKRYGAILDRYATEVPRIGKRLAKQLGGRWGEATLATDRAPPDHLARFLEELSTRLRATFSDRFVDDYLANIEGELGAEEASANPHFALTALVQARIEDAERGGQEAERVALTEALDDANRAVPVARVQVPAIEITPALREAVLAGQPMFQRDAARGPRGQIVGRDRQSIIRQKADAAGVREFHIDLLAGADLSTFLHEGAHAFLEMFADLAESAEAPAQVKEDWQKVLAYLGVADRSQIGRDQHETWARSFEAYAREGKAPSGALRRAFAAFKVWLTHLYRSAAALNVSLTDEVRGVFDRMLASDAEIAHARQAVYLEPLIADAVALGMTPEQHAAYQRAVQAALERAEADLTADVLRAQQQAQAAWWRAERRRVRAEVEAATRALPVYRALRWLRQGLLPDGAPVPQPLKLDRAALLDLYGKAFPRKRLAGLYAVEGGVHPDVAAAVLGYPSGAELVEALVAAPPLQEAIDADTDRIMGERHPDPLTDGSLPARAAAAVESDHQAALMVREINLLEAKTGQGGAPTALQVMRQVARELIAGKRAREVAPHVYRAAEAKAGREAFTAARKGDWTAAADARRRQLLNLLLAQEATRVQREVASAGRFLRNMTRAKRRAAVGKAGGTFLEQIDGLLERFDFRALSGAAAERRERLGAWVDRMRGQGVDVDLPAQLLDDAYRKPFALLTVVEVRALRDAVKHLAHLADLKNSLLVGRERLDKAAVDAAVAASITAAHAARPERTGDRRRLEQLRAGWLKVRGVLAAATDLARFLDGETEQGAVWRHTVGLVRAAVFERANPALNAAQEALAALYHRHFSMAELRALDTPRVLLRPGDAWSRGRILALALNWGNAGNREAILTQARARLSAEEVGRLLQTLSARDWDFVEAVWAQIDGYWPAIAEAQKRRKGLAPAKVEASPFVITLADGSQRTVRGGYFPLKYEADSVRGLEESADDYFEAIRTGRFAKAATRDGHTIERVGSGGRTVRLDLAVVDSHLRDVIRDVHLGDAVNAVYQVLHGPQVKRALADAELLEVHQALELWLKDVAAGEMGLRSGWERALRLVRGNFTAAVLTWKAVSAALQVTGVVQTSAVLGKVATVQGLLRYAANPLAAARHAYAASPFMAARVHSHIEAVQLVRDARAGRLASARGAMIRHGYWMIGRVQALVDLVTWLAAEGKGLEEFGGDPARARAFADDIVSRAQGSGEFVDKTALQRGTLDLNHRQSELVRASQALLGYLVAKHNAVVGRTARARRDLDGFSAKSVRVGLDWSLDMANLLVVEAILAAVLRGTLPGDDDDDGSVADDWAGFVTREALSSLVGAFPGLAQATTELRGYDAKGVVADAWHAVGQAIAQAQQGELDRAAVKSVVDVAGFAFGLPSGQIDKTIDALAAHQQGQELAPYEYVTGPSRDHKPQ